MLHVTIKDTETNEVVYDCQEVSAIAMQAVDREKITALRHTAEGGDPKDTLLCMKVLLKEASEAKNLISEALAQVVDKLY